MELFSLITNLVAEPAKLARALLADGLRVMALLARPRTALAAENLFLRKQLAFYQERKIRPRHFDNASRFMLVLLSHGFAWKDSLVNVTPKTFIGWHRKGFRLFWRWKSRPGRPRIPAELRALIREMALRNASWGEERIANELLLKLGIRVSVLRKNSSPLLLEAEFPMRRTSIPNMGTVKLSNLVPGRQ